MTENLVNPACATKLLPCPFCGGTDATNVFEQVGAATIRCPDCGAEGPIHLRDDAQEAATAHWNRRAALPAQTGEWQLVPVEPTEAMIRAGWHSVLYNNAAGVWRDMLAAAPPSGG